MSSSTNDDKHLHGAIAGDGSTFQEALFGLMSGAVFGLVSPIVGHPLDCIKTKLQAEAAFRDATFRHVVQTVWKREGLLGFYRGFLPPLAGSMAYRGILFSAYSGAYAACEHVPALHEPIPHTGGLRPSVLVGSVAAAVARATIESPLDFIKVRRQIGKSTMDNHHSTAGTEVTSGAILKSFISNPVSNIRHLYHGYTATLMRTMGLLGSFFVLVDYSVRYIPDVVNAPLIGPFFKGGVCATAAWCIAFPFETAKSVIQSDNHYKGKSTIRVMRDIFQKRGMRGLYRGFGPGASRSFVANGTSMIVYAWFQDTMREAT